MLDIARRPTYSDDCSMGGTPANRSGWQVVRCRWTHLVLILAAAIGVVAVAAPRAGAYVYLAGPVTSHTPAPSTIERMTLDGSGVQTGFITGPRIESGGQLEVYGDRLYWFDSSAGHCLAKSAALDGTDVQTLAWIQSVHCGSGLSMVVAGGYLYWGASGPGTIGRMSVEPPYNAEPDFIRLPKMPCCIDRGEAMSLVTDGEWLYWFDDIRNTVGRARIDGTDVDPAVFQPVPPSGGKPAMGVVLFGVAHGYLWWKDGRGTGSIGRARPDGSDRDPDYLTGIQAYDGALTPHWLYYTGSSCGMSGCVSIDGAVSRVALERGAIPRPLANLGEGVGSSLAVDSLGDQYPTVRIRKHRNGTATALVSTDRPATVSVRGKRIVHARARQVRAKLAGVAIRPRPGARRALRRHGAVHVEVRIAYRAVKDMPQFRTRSLTLRLGRR